MAVLKWREIPVGVPYYSVTEEVWYRSGPDDADRDFEFIADVATLEEAREVVSKTDTHNRIYIDQMVKDKPDAAGGSVVFAGYKSQFERGDDWRLDHLRFPVSREAIFAAASRITKPQVA